jgi:hypothetical protein
MFAGIDTNSRIKRNIISYIKYNRMSLRQDNKVHLELLIMKPHIMTGI